MTWCGHLEHSRARSTAGSAKQHFHPDGRPSYEWAYRDGAETNRHAVREMHRQVGRLTIGADGLARRGLLIRHLVLPGDVAVQIDLRNLGVGR